MDLWLHKKRLDLELWHTQETRVAPVEEKLIQHRLRWFEHIQWRPTETPIRNEILRRTGNEKRGRERLNLTWEESVKRYLKNWCITKKLALDRREWKLAIHVPEHWSSLPSFYYFFVKKNSTHFHFFDLTFYCLFSLFD
jgi:hypothetical protein